MTQDNMLVWLLVGGGVAALVYYLHSAGYLSFKTPTPLSVYPEFAYTAPVPHKQPPLLTTPYGAVIYN
jgi:hypothetical protein